MLIRSAEDRQLSVETTLHKATRGRKTDLEHKTYVGGPEVMLLKTRPMQSGLWSSSVLFAPLAEQGPSQDRLQGSPELCQKGICNYQDVEKPLHEVSLKNEEYNSSGM